MTTNGLYYKQNPLFSGSEDLAISIGLYVDEFEICNPLGTSRKKHKITAIYWVLAHLPAKHRSILSNIYLAVLSNSNDVKNFGFEPVVEPLLKELCTLENQAFRQRHSLVCVIRQFRCTFFGWLSRVI